LALLSFDLKRLQPIKRPYRPDLLGKVGDFMAGYDRAVTVAGTEVHCGESGKFEDAAP
jgi:hypothetical protein